MLNIAADIILLGYRRRQVEIVLVERKYEPFRGCWALPGGFVEDGETLKEAAHRELKEETGVSEVELNLLPRYFDSPHRDPRGRVISAVFWGITLNPPQVKGGTDAQSAQWFSVSNLPCLAFDHQEIVAAVKDYLSELYASSLPLLRAARPLKVGKLMEVIELLCGLPSANEPTEW